VARANVELIIEATNAVNPLKRVAKETAKTEKQVNLLQKAIKAQSKAVDVAKTKLIGFGNASKKAFATAQKAAGKLQAKLGGLKGAIVGLGAAALTKRMIGQAASFAQTQVRLKALSAEYGEYGQIQKLVKENAETFNQSQAESASNFADVFARLRPLGTSLEDIQTVYKGFNATALASGTSAAAASGAFLQLSQALGSGRLQGDEFRSIAEQVPGILRLVSDEMGVTVGELKKLGSDGKITSDILINSLAKGFEENKGKIQQLLAESPAQKFKEFSNATSELSNAVGAELLPVITPAVETLTSLLKAVGDLPKPIKTAGAAILLLTAAVVVLVPLVSPLAVGIASLAPAAIAAGGGAKFLAGAMIGLNAAMAAAPWVALVAGLAYVAKGAVDAKTKIDNLEASLRDASGTGEELKQKMQETADKIETLKGQLDKAGPSAAFLQKKIDLLTESLNKMKGRYDIEIVLSTFGVDVASLEDGFFGPAGAAIKPKKKEKPTVTPSGAGKGKSAAQGPQDISAAMETLLLKQQELRFSNDELAKSTLQYEIDIQRIIDSQSQPRERNLALVTAQNDKLLRQKEILEKIFKAAAAIDDKIKAGNLAGVKAGFAAGKAADEQISKLTETEKLANSIGAQLGTGITDALVGAVKGTKDLGEAFQELASDILEAVGKALILKAVTAAIGSVGGGGGDDAGSGLLGLLFREKGGPVSANQPYVVGERGPELFVPGASGSITNNQQFEAARSSMSFYNGGGGGTPAYSPNIQATTMPDGMQYVTVEQMNSTVQAGMKVAANQGAAGGQSRTMNALRNSRSQRSKIGLGR
jgi:tape measure domain-containing protein